MSPAPADVLGWMSDLTSDYAVVKAAPGRFVWGKVVAWHEVGRYQILEYDPLVPVRTCGIFHVYVDKVSQNTSASSLEAALVIAIALGCLEVNHAHHMSTACLKVLGLEP